MTSSESLDSIFFSSRRRHTRCSRDWSSDVCSSDLPSIEETFYTLHPREYLQRKEQAGGQELIDQVRPEEYQRFAEEYLELGCGVAAIKAGHNGWDVRTGPPRRRGGPGRGAP